MHKFIVFTLLFSLLAVLFLVSPQNASASLLQNASDTISTSRPSTLTSLASDQAGNSSSLILSDSSALVIGEDSAQVGNDLITVTSSSANTPVTGQRTVHAKEPITNPHPKGTAFTVPIAALHTIKFTLANSVPQNGKITLTFPGEGSTSVSPSATTFAFNNLATSNASSFISYKLDGTATCTFSILAPSMTCTTSAQIASGTQVVFLIGCADASSNATTCSKKSPVLLNPTKSKSETADLWTIQIKTENSSGSTIDSAKVKIATTSPGEVRAVVDPTLIFSLSGIQAGAVVSTNNPDCTQNTDRTDQASTSKQVGLGTLSATKTTVAVQDLMVSTNAYSGYAIKAQSAYSLRNEGGREITSSTSPSIIQPGQERFGIHACGKDAEKSFFGTGSVRNGGAKVAWPNQDSPLTLASRSTLADQIRTTVQYAATIGDSTPTGVYKTVVTYIVTPTF